ncbi:MAG TPA: outer membrane protein assembly factor BamD, partial [Roseateles sp.]
LAFRQLVEQFPDSKYAAEATTRINFITNTLAAYEIHVARYYFNRKAYVAAANRAQSAVAEFQYAPGIEEGLFIMSESYDKLGLTQLRDDARRVLDKNFPDSQYASNGTKRKKPWWQLW